MNMDAINNIANAMASQDRNERNRGKHVNQKGWVTHEEARRNAAQNALGLMVLIAVCALLFKLIGFMWRYKIGRIILIGIVGIFVLAFVGSMIANTRSRDLSENRIESRVQSGEQDDAGFSSPDVVVPTTRGRRAAEGQGDEGETFSSSPISVVKPEVPQEEYACRFCGQHSFNRLELDNGFCHAAPRDRGQVRHHQAVLAREYKEPITKMCIKCGDRTRFPDLMTDEACREGGKHAFFMTGIKEPRVSTARQRFSCYLCGKDAGHYLDVFSKEKCEARPHGQESTHQVVPLSQYKTLKVFKCSHCGLPTRFPWLHWEEECEGAFSGSHDFGDIQIDLKPLVFSKRISAVDDLIEYEKQQAITAEGTSPMPIPDSSKVLPKEASRPIKAVEDLRNGVKALQKLF